MSTAIANVDPENDVHVLMQRVSDPHLKFGQRLDSVAKVMQRTSAKMMAALPKHITPDRMIRVAMNCIRKNPKLLDCAPASLFGAMTEAATYGWELGGVLGHAYLVPFKTECQLIPGYKGLIDLCRRSGQISTISLEVVHDGDKFSYSLGDEPHIKHVPNDRDPKRDEKPITYAYAVVVLRDGGVQRGVWSREKIDAHKEQYSSGWRWAENGDKSKGGGKKDSPWHTAWPTMAKKTVIRDMIQRGLVPLSAEYRDLADRATQYGDEDDQLDAIDLLPAGAIEGEATPADEPPQSDPGAELDAAFLSQAAAAFDAETAELGVIKLRDQFKEKCGTEDERTAIDGMAQTATQRILDARAAKHRK